MLHLCLIGSHVLENLDSEQNNAHTADSGKHCHEYSGTL